MEKENSSPDGTSLAKVFFSVQDAADGRKFKVFLKPGDMPKLKVQKIRRTLSQTTGYPVERITLYKDHKVLEDSMAGSSFDLNPNSVLSMQISHIQSATTTPSRSPPPPPPPTPPTSETRSSAYSTFINVTPKQATTPRLLSTTTTPPAANANRNHNTTATTNSKWGANGTSTTTTTADVSPARYLNNPFLSGMPSPPPPLPPCGGAQSVSPQRNSTTYTVRHNDVAYDDGDHLPVETVEDVVQEYVQEVQHTCVNLQRELNSVKSELKSMKRRNEFLQESLAVATQQLASLHRCDPQMLATLSLEIGEERAKYSELQRANNTLLQQLRSETQKRKALESKVEELSNLQGGDAGSGGGLMKVLVRLRPLGGKEIPNPTEGTIACSGSSVVISTPGIGTRTFSFNKAFGDTASDDELWKEFHPSLRKSMEAMTPSCFVVYGQTGSGKSKCMDAMMRRTFDEVFAAFESLNADEYEYSVCGSAVEVYLDHFRDLNTSLVSSSTNSANTSQHQQKSSTGTPLILQQLMSSSHASETYNLVASSRRPRSHFVYFLTVKTRANGNNNKIRSATFAFVDLAGSERVSRNQTQRDRIAETQCVNKSLSAFGDVLAAVSSKSQSSHVPFRNSKLTMLLQDVLGHPQCRTTVCACLAPAASNTCNYSETLATLTYVSRVKTLVVGGGNATMQLQHQAPMPSVGNFKYDK
eukprot:PhF_6_TR26260/c0_g1_i1/m.37574